MPHLEFFIASLAMCGITCPSLYRCCEQALQNQLYGGQPSPWNFGAAYRIPDTNINLSGTYQQGKANLQARVDGFDRLDVMHHTGSLCVPSRGVVKRVDYQPEQHGSVWMSTPVCGDHVVAEPPCLGYRMCYPDDSPVLSVWVVFVPVVDWHCLLDVDYTTTAVDYTAFARFFV